MSSQTEILRTDAPFRVVSQYTPSGDQPAAIAELAERIDAGEKDVVLLGATGTGKSATAAWLIERVQRPTLVIEPNKTLAAQMATEFRELMPDNAVEYFVSYYDYYQPEAYVPQTDTFIEKDSSINDEVERLRHSATNSLLTRRDTVVVASVSCIYGLGTPEEYVERMVLLRVGQRLDRDDLLRTFVGMQYVRNDIAFVRGTFRVRGDTVEIIPVYEELAIRIEFFGDEIDSISLLHPVTGTVIRRTETAHVFPASHYVAGPERMARALTGIEDELAERLEALRAQGKLLEAQRLQMRTTYDVEMMRNIGSCAGIENYSRHIDGRGPGTPPHTLLDYFPEDFLLIVDESHVTVPPDRGHVRGRRLPQAHARRIRVPPALRPGQPAADVGRIPGARRPIRLPVGDTREVRTRALRRGRRADHPADRLVDPLVVVKPTEGQIDDLLGQIKDRVERDERVLVTTLTKKMAEDLTDYLAERGVKVEYLHSDVDTLRRVELLRELRLGSFDVLVGINLLREGLDLPEVSLVAILDADKQGFLRSTTSLIQTIGRAARNVSGEVHMYADSISSNMREAIDETNRRRAKQIAFNEEHGIDPQPLRKKIADVTDMLAREDVDTAELLEGGYRQEKGAGVRERARDEGGRDLVALIEELTALMHEAASSLKFELAARYRDEIKGLKSELWHSQQAQK